MLQLKIKKEECKSWITWVTEEVYQWGIVSSAYRHTWLKANCPAVWLLSHNAIQDPQFLQCCDFLRLWSDFYNLESFTHENPELLYIHFKLAPSLFLYENIQ